MSKVHRVSLETPHYTFEAFGRTEGEAILAFRNGWSKHAEATGAAAFESTEFVTELFPDLQYHTITTGACYRDRTEVAHLVPKKQRSAAGGRGGYREGSGRKRSKAPRCQCGANTLARAEKRGYDCCRLAGVLPWVLRIKDSMGQWAGRKPVVSLHDSEEAAEQELGEYVRERWPLELDEPMPEDISDAIGQYFDSMDEVYTIEKG